VNVFDGIEPSAGQTLLATIRHGLTELNRDKRVGGHVDAPLIDEGRRQAEDAREAFAGTPFDVVIASPLSRAIETAEIVTGRPSERIVIDEEALERSFGAMDGLHPWEVRERFPDVRYLTIDGIGYSINPPGGEPFEALHARAEAFLRRTLERFAGLRVLVFSHQNFMQQLHGVIRGLDPIASLEVDLLNCELNAFLLDAEAALVEHRRVLLVPTAAEHPSF
jgi:broad specificity phosphatase PhoE